MSKKEKTKYTCCGGPTAVGGHQPHCSFFPNSNLNKLRQAIIKEIPEIVRTVVGRDKISFRGKSVYEERPITLADVLRVLNKKWKGFFMVGLGDNDNEIEIMADNENAIWILDKSLNEQSKETIDFLANIILKEK